MFVMEKMVLIHIIVSGRVQGVRFRNSTRKIAEPLGIVGFARNLEDGRVEIKAKHYVKDQIDAFSNLSKRFIKRVKTVPKHVVIIPDGNRRWAKGQGLKAWDGHREGFSKVTDLSQALRDQGVKNFTLWGFSTENWNRSTIEVSHLMNIFLEGIHVFRKEAFEHNIQFRHLGRKDRLPKKLVEALNALEQDTQHFKDYNFCLALDYGGRDELVRAAQKLQTAGKPATEENINEYLDTYGLPDPDFIIRTSGEMRTSGMMPWQGAYAEFYTTPLCFPDFTPKALQIALEEFSSRQRRFGS